MKMKWIRSINWRDRKVWIVSGVLLLFILYFIMRPSPHRVELSKVRKGVYEQHVLVEGKTRVKERFVILSPVSGVLERIHHHAGDVVKKGDHLATIRWDSPRRVTAPVDGAILSIERESEGPIEMGSVIMTLGNTQDLEVEADVLTREAVHVQPGNAVTLFDWGGPELQATVKRVEPSGRTRISALGVEEQRTRIIMELPQAPPQLADGFRVQCRIVTVSRKDSLILPTAALFRSGEDWAVFRVEGNKARLLKVVLEMRGPDDALPGAQGEDGLKEGDAVILFPGEGILDGDRLSPMP
ncbi:MAG: efflux RND transporter periplasmic adaptor subunit [Spirochaetales bacterium]|nr:efflux RND transporter periplasmic adaptor subunit [Spirochaetales bacterium]